MLYTVHIIRLLHRLSFLSDSGGKLHAFYFLLYYRPPRRPRQLSLATHVESGGRPRQAFSGDTDGADAVRSGAPLAPGSARSGGNGFSVDRLDCGATGGAAPI